MPACYDRALPTDAMLGAAGFNARKQTTFFIARDVLVPPSDLMDQIFPWVEDEQRALSRRAEGNGIHGRDNSLVLFLDLLIFLRKVLLQDAAVLFSSYPNCPVFKYPPFNSTSFHEFSAASSRIISAAEDDVKHQLDALPEDIAATFRAAMMTTAMHLERDRLAREASNSRLEERMGVIQNIATASFLSGATGKKRKAFEASLEMLENTRPAPARMSSCASSHTSVTPLASIPNIVPDIQPSQSNETGMLSAAETAPASTHSHTPDHQVPTTVVSNSGNIYSSLIFPISSSEPSVVEKQQSAITTLESIFPAERLMNHQFDWDEKTSTWLPKFSFWKPKSNVLTVDNIWREDRFGIDGLFSIQELNAQWDARWKRNNHSIKQEAYWRKKVVNIIDTLSRKPNWNGTIAFRFLHDVYKTQMKTGRTFSDYLTRATTAQIIEASGSYVK
ncbi:hypothetical protein HYPSUDRAFT_59993 [Hypholoma sublateritium FD-334 SS-4]|uniref:Transcription activator GCR1-like domain-containing protein n=1 Tax=Hypholoma sublateritium (strain FD-334 SS-4) TaxID=945553 RepID=A0A0D2LR32_HYPSF|nr:hypothetical protein HYPSUDRAFT_59993 [Hypholoma sublateritium FD-334 SS-4]